MKNLGAIRSDVQALDGVLRSWFEWEFSAGNRRRILVVEVVFGIDPTTEFDSTRLVGIEDVVKLHTDLVEVVRVVPMGFYKLE